mmetsp:Transcript_10159/g.21617  ORF Transcript_10159/g.21617 Transcript_10159/m.21617 type:complete len:80 (+) Transcript_10159:350-589(+)
MLSGDRSIADTANSRRCKKVLPCLCCRKPRWQRSSRHNLKERVGSRGVLNDSHTKTCMQLEENSRKEERMMPESISAMM